MTRESLEVSRVRGLPLGQGLRGQDRAGNRVHPSDSGASGRVFRGALSPASFETRVHIQSQVFYPSNGLGHPGLASSFSRVSLSAACPEKPLNKTLLHPGPGYHLGVHLRTGERRLDTQTAVAASETERQNWKVNRTQCHSALGNL